MTIKLFRLLSQSWPCTVTRNVMVSTLECVFLSHVIGPEVTSITMAAVNSTCVPTMLPHSLKGRKLCCVTYFCRSVQITGQPQMFLCPVYCRCRFENENYAWWKSFLITDIPLMFFKIKFTAGSSICDSSKFESVCRTFPRKFKSSFFKISSPRACTLKMWESFSERVLEDLVILRCTTFDACDCIVCSLRLLFLGRYHLKQLVLGLSELERGGSNIFRNVTVYKSTCHCNPDTWLLYFKYPAELISCIYSLVIISCNFY